MNIDRVLSPQDIAAMMREVLSSMHCALPGNVISFDKDTQTAVIRPAVKGMPLLRDVPVFMPVPFDVSPGDACLMIFADRDIDAWLESGEEEEPIYKQYHVLGGNGDMRDLRRTFRHLQMEQGGVPTEVSDDE